MRLERSARVAAHVVAERVDQGEASRFEALTAVGPRAADVLVYRLLRPGRRAEQEAEADEG
jgi:hypothetical protein